ncbi:MAG: DUF5074 domain-containing protein [Muribaculaceae bacterium]|nr:DUF5074 domain-containing protein [Muribaculaceae bacterium]
MKKKSYFLLLRLTLIGLMLDVAYPTEMSAQTPTEAQIDFDKIKFFVGEGDKTAALVVQWNDKWGAGNVVFGYRFNSDTKMIGDMMDQLVTDDPRVIDSKAWSDGIALDLNGDHKISALYDHLQIISDEETRWRFFTKTGNEPYREATATDIITDKSVVYYTYIPNRFAHPYVPYCFYRPAADAPEGIYVPEKYVYCHTGEEEALPYFIIRQDPTDKLSLLFKWTLTENDGVIKSINAAKRTPVFSSPLATGKAKATLSMTITHADKSKYETPSEPMDIDICLPWVTATAMRFIDKEKSVPMNSSYTNPIVFDPVGTTYVKVNYSSDNTEIATVGTDGAVQTTMKEGSAVITATYAIDDAVNCSYTVNTEAPKFITDFNFPTGNDISIPYKGLFEVIPEITPADASLKEFTVEIVNEDIATEFGGNRYPYSVIVSHKPGKTKLILTAKDDGAFSKTFDITVNEPHSGGISDFTDGTILLNEEWYGHTNGSFNYLKPDGTIIYRPYEAINGYRCFGCTSQFGTIWNGKLFVMSKQSSDGGDPNPGHGCTSIVDAKTLKNIADINPGGEGRSVIGINPSKVYVTTKDNDINVLNLDDLTETEIEGSGAYTYEHGDMVKSGKYVFATRSDNKLFIIDSDEDEVVKTVDIHQLGGVCVTPDNKVWLSSYNTLYCMNPETLEIERTVVLPENMYIESSWGMWRSQTFFSHPEENTIFFKGGSYYLYRWDTDSDISSAEVIYNSNSHPEYLGFYGTPVYDARTNEIIMTTSGGAAYAAMENYVIFLDPMSGNINKVIPMQRYFWFPSMVILPDKYAPVIKLQNISIKENDSHTFSLPDLATDPDENDYDRLINLSLVSNTNPDIVETSLNGQNLTVKGIKSGSAVLKLRAESRGVVTEKNIPVEVSATAAVTTAEINAVALHVSGSQISLTGLSEGDTIRIYNTLGYELLTTTATTTSFDYVLNHGVYVIMVNTKAFKIVI